MTQQEYESVLARISSSSGEVDSTYKKIGDASPTLCDVNQTMSYNPNMTVVRNKGGEVVGYDYKYTTPQLPNPTALEQDSNIDSGLYASGGGGQTRGGGAGRFQSSQYAGTIVDEAGSTDKAGGTGFVSGLISPVWAAVSAAAKFGKHVTEVARDTMSSIGDALADGFENLLIPATEQTGDSIRALFGADSEHGEVSMYLDEDTIGALGITLRDNGVFDIEGSAIDTETYEIIDPNHYVNLPVVYGAFDLNPGDILEFYNRDGTVRRRTRFNSITSTLYIFGVVNADRTQYVVSMCSLEPFNWTGIAGFSGRYDSTVITINNKTFYMGTFANYLTANDIGVNTQYPDNYTNAPTAPGSGSGVPVRTIGYIILYGVPTTSIDGVSDEPGATIPVDAITGADPHVVAQQLEQQYPSVMGSPVQVLVMDDSCNQVVKKYYQIPISYSPTTVTITAPTTGTTQISPSFNPSISLPDIDMSKFMEQIVLQLSGSGAGDTIVQVEQPDSPASEPIIKVIETVPPDTGSGITPPSEFPQVSVTSMWHVYNPSSAELSSLGQWLWSTNVLDVLIRTFANPLESIMGVHAIYGEPQVSSSASIVVGPLTSSVSARVVSSQYTSVDCGSIWFTEYFGNVFDYSPFTTVSLFLPFVGIVDLSVSDIMRAEISVSYNIDVYTGAAVAFVTVNRDGVGGILYQYPCNCAVEYPVSGASYSRLFQSVMSAATSALSAGVASGGNPIVGAIAAGSSFMSGSEKIGVQRSGSFSGNIGAMGCKIPYLIISRPQTNTPANFEFYDGLSSDYISQLSACHGYTKCKEVHLNCPGAYKSELDEIESLLLAGVIFPD